MGRWTRTGVAVLTAGALLAGCGDEKTDGERAGDALGTFVEAVEAKDGAAICASLTPNAVRSVEKLARAQKRPRAGCADLVRKQLGGFRPPPGEKLDITTNREVAPGRRDLVAPLLNDLTTGALTFAKDDGGSGFRLALFASDTFSDQLKRSTACSSLRQTILRLPLPPATVARYPEYLRRVAGRVDRERRAVRRAFGESQESKALASTVRGLRRAARDIAKGRNTSKAKLRADGWLTQLDGLMRYTELTFPGRRHDCGPDPHLSDRAKAFRKRVGKRCRSTLRTFRRLDRELDSAVGATAFANLLAEGRQTLRRLGTSLEAGALPDLLDDTRDATVKDLRRLDRIIVRELAAIRALDLPAIEGIIRELEGYAFAGDIGLTRLKLRDCYDDTTQAVLSGDTQRA